MQKTEQKTEQQAGLGMSFCEEEGRITVFRKTLEALEWPSHYRFLYNRKMKQIAVQACGAEEAGAHRVENQTNLIAAKSSVWHWFA